MNGAQWLAEQLKTRNNPEPFAPIEGIVVELPEIKIRINRKVVLQLDEIRSIVDLRDKDADGNYLWINRRVYLLPFNSSHSISVQKYLVIGGDAI